jgi:hypothetical protein
MSTATATHNHGDTTPCGCHGHDDPPVTCCKMVCFERPEFFCGHLLTDEDLSLGLRYTIEKNKLRNRSLHGSGVVCGLGLTCAPDCGKSIEIATGYAIDDCGNDLVVCEPKRLNVIEELRRKGYLIDEARDPCDDREDDGEDPDCPEKLCFYVVACYEEERSQYTTPFDAGCNAGPKQCLPTRVAERVRIALTDTLPKRPNPLEAVREGIEDCFTVFTTGPIGRTLKANIEKVQVALGGDASRPDGKDQYCEVFCTLRAHFLQHLYRHPDKYSCGLYSEIKALNCPKPDAQDYASELQDAFTRLLEAMERYRNDCVLGHALLTCPEPCEASCVVLGTVEVAAGKLVRVCNSPRWYVWSFVNALPLLHWWLTTRPAAALGAEYGRAHTTDTVTATREPSEVGCCPTYRHDPQRFLETFQIDEKNGMWLAMSPLITLQGFQDALSRGFDFTDPEAISPVSLQKGDLNEVMKAAETLGLKATIADESITSGAFGHPLYALFSSANLRRGDMITAARAANGTISVAPSFGAAAAPPDRATDALRAEVAALRTQLDERKGQIEKLGDDMAALRTQVATLGRPRGKKEKDE